MYARALKAVWLLSLIVFTISFFYVYASLPETVLLEWARFAVTTSRNILFYAALLMVTLVNVLVFLIKSPSERSGDAPKIWAFGQVIAMNFFFIVALVFVMLTNSGVQFNPKPIGILVYSSVALLVLCTLGGLIYLTLKHIRR